MPLNETDKTAQQAYQNIEDLEKGLAYIYGSYSLVSQNDAGSSDIAVEDAGQSELLRQYVVLNEMSVDALKCAWGDSYITDTQNATWSATPNAATIAVYTRCMVTVTRANEFLVQSKESSIEGVAGLRAEARFLRAYAYYMLLDLYGNPPFATEENIGGELPKQFDTNFSTGRKSLFEWIESELKDLLASGDMPEIGEVSYPRVNKGAAQALLARMYLNAQVYTGTARWEDARSAAEATINMGYTLCLDNVKLTAIPTRHLGKSDALHFSFIIEGSRRIVFMGDASPSELSKLSAFSSPDLIIVPFAFLNTEATFKKLKAFGAKEIVAVHMPDPENDPYGIWETVKNTTKDENVRHFSKIGDTITLQ